MFCTKQLVTKSVIFIFRTAVQNFSFVFTGEDGFYTFGFCRMAPNCQTALVRIFLIE